MKSTVKRAKGLILAIIFLPLLTVAMLDATAAPFVVVGDDTDTAALYKAKCAMCHGAKAEKSFDAAKPDEQLTGSVLKGVKPKMPAYEEKGIGADQAKALVAYMKQLKQ